MSNEAPNNVEDALVDHIKSDTMMRAVAGNEDLLHKLATRAVEEAFFKPVSATNSYGRSEVKHQSKAVMAADAIANGLAQRVVKEFWEDEAFKTAIREALIANLPAIISATAMSWMHNQVLMNMQNAEMNLKNDIEKSLQNAGMSVYIDR